MKETAAQEDKFIFDELETLKKRINDTKGMPEPLMSYLTDGAELDRMARLATMPPSLTPCQVY